MWTRYFPLIVLQYNVFVNSLQCFQENPKLGEIHPFVEIEVIKKETYPTRKNGSHLIIKCTANAPRVNSQLYNPDLLNPSVISFFFHGKRVPVNNCRPSSGSRQKTCQLAIQNPGAENDGQYYCKASNGYRCTTIGASVSLKPCPAPGGKEKQALDFFQYNIIEVMKCLKSYSLCCITESNCRERYRQCLQDS